ncbi:aminotransferase class V-fold PLP-dependent enzyme [Lacihabitans sp. LS3-19]|uniref:aminotransferase class V-fold PLP-dependent enzyme n=1 Tax=Lacihabitans sp. LS3-19 TaxID=2487335 RepID=UPI0020CFE0D0|nr:aminotransferase class V-fold PLP-dependent enzyme [Lacihabitans sp. LS3-19]MCP9770692.1 aminotransferase class V-fold PLP-dependent enzyme [Lacihabitans sp. LS3-19]
MDCKKDYFSLSPDVRYLNCATMSPLAKTVEEAGIKGLLRKSQPYEISSADFFSLAEVVKRKFAELINCINAERIALMPSVSYGIATVVKNIAQKSTDKLKTDIVLVGEEFPSDVYGWHELVELRDNTQIVTVSAPVELNNRGEVWNENLLEAITEKTLLVCISPTHWADGTLFNLEEIKNKCTHTGALLIIDATQHLGAFEFDLQKIQPDFLVCASYKWLLGPYGSTLAYFGPYFDEGLPLEQTWIGRKNSDDFKNLLNYQPEYREGAFRYNMGEYSNFINLPMVEKALELLIEWQPKEIQEYAKNLGQPFIERLSNSGYWIENESFRSAHMFGIRLPENVKMENIQKSLSAEKVHVSYRGNAIRLSINVWNEAHDLDVFSSILEANQ